jgi:desulfoferrodoxin (superoxide reductase-like protein)
MEKGSAKAEEPDAAKQLAQEWEWKEAASNLGQRKGVLTAHAPGAWAGKELSHVPVVVSSGGRCSVAVPHPSTTPEHWVEWVWARDDATGSVLAVKKFAPGEKPELTFEVPASVKTVTAFEACNL